jgi:hypothetical protein
MGVQIETREVVVRELPPVKRAGLAVGEEFGVSCGHANQDKVWVSDPDGVEREVYVLNHDIEDDASRGVTPMARPLPTAKAGGGCS